MSQLAIITPTGNSSINQVFAGVMGSITDGKFVPIEQFRGIPTLSTLSDIPELKEITSCVTELTVPDHIGDAVKAALAFGLSARWAGLYDSVIDSAPEGFARSAVAAERAMVLRKCDEVVGEMGLEPRKVQIRKVFDNVPTAERFDQEDYTDEYDSDVDFDVDGKQLSTSQALAQNVAPWTLEPFEIDMGALVPVLESNNLTDQAAAASGVIVRELTVYGNDVQGFVDAINQLSEDLLTKLLPSSGDRFFSGTMHAMRPVEAQIADMTHPDGEPQAPSNT